MLAATRQRFLDDYIKIRHAEGRGSQDAEYYLALPFRDVTGRLQDQWTIRAKSYRYLERRVLPGIEKQFNQPLRIADLGAGNCWLSYRLALRGHRPIAIDILGDPLDGIHYSTDYRRTLVEIRRCLRPDGCFLIVDSPIYQRREHGEMMVRERHQQFQKAYGFASDTLRSIEYFDTEMLGELGRDLGISWKIYRPWYGWQWAMRPWKARWHGKRPPSNFWILAGRFEA
jgi:hypothetical protein